MREGLRVRTRVTSADDCEEAMDGLIDDVEMCGGTPIRTKATPIVLSQKYDTHARVDKFAYGWAMAVYYTGGNDGEDDAPTIDEIDAEVIAGLERME